MILKSPPEKQEIPIIYKKAANLQGGDGCFIFMLILVRLFFENVNDLSDEQTMMIIVIPLLFNF